jgi:hypothetical protein
VACYLSYFIQVFTNALFFTGTNLDERKKILGMLRTQADRFLQKYSGGNPQGYLERVISNLFNVLKKTEVAGSKAPTTEVEIAFADFLAQDSMSTTISQAVMGFFTEALPFYGTLATREVLGSVPYPLVLAYYIVFAQKYLTLIRKQLVAAQCPLPVSAQSGIRTKQFRELKPAAAASENALESFLAEPAEEPAPAAEPVQRLDDVVQPVPAEQFLTADWQTLGIAPTKTVDDIVLAYRRKGMQLKDNPTELKSLLNSYLRILADLQGKPLPPRLLQRRASVSNLQTRRIKQRRPSVGGSRKMQKQ